MVYLQITLMIERINRAAACIYQQYKETFLEKIQGAKSKTQLVRDEEV